MKNLIKQLRPIIVIVITLIVGHPVLAHDFAVDGIYYNITDETNKTVSVTYKGSLSISYTNEYSGDIIVPELVSYCGETYLVTEVGYAAFSRCYFLKSVVLPSSVMSIGYQSFDQCIGLESITIPNSVTTIGDEAFKECGHLNSLTANGVTWIGEKAFSGCGNLASVTIESIRQIGTEAFYECWKLKSINISKHLKKVEDWAFFRCADTTEVNITDLSAWCKIEYSNPLRSSNPLSVGGILKLNGVEITDLFIPDDITKIKQDAFNNCIGLTSLTIGEHITNIGRYAFFSCDNLTEITSYCSTPPLCEEDAFYGSYSAILKIPEGSKKAYLNAAEWKKFTNIQEIAGVEDVKTDDDVVEIERYDIHGRLLTEPSLGINIVKMSDGTTRKEVVN